MNYELVLLSSTLAINISKKLTVDELTLLSSFLVSLADNLALIASQSN